MTITRSPAASRKPSLAFCDNHLLVAEGLARALSDRYEIKAILKSGRDLDDLLQANPPDAVVTEIELADRNGLVVLERAAGTVPPIPFVICTSVTDPGALHRAFQAGARGVVSKQEGLVALQEAIDFALQGQPYLSNTIMQWLIDEQRLPPMRITARQQMILDLVAEGLMARQIAEKLGLSRRTVESHKAHLRRMTNTHSPQELRAFARRLGLLQPRKLTVPG